MGWLSGLHYFGVWYSRSIYTCIYGCTSHFGWQTALHSASSSVSRVGYWCLIGQSEGLVFYARIKDNNHGAEWVHWLMSDRIYIKNSLMIRSTMVSVSCDI